jgi:uncharacterized protein (TIGR03086 family)
MTSDSVVDLASRAALRTLDFTSGISATDLSRPTPCAAWDLGDLLAHMHGQNRGFAAAAKGWGGDLAAWAPVPVSPDSPSSGYALSVHAVLFAFTVAVELGQGMRVPEVDPLHDFPAATAVSFHLVDSVAHGWDIARALGQPYHVDDDVLAAAKSIATIIPDDSSRTEASALFAPALPATDDIPLSDFLRLLGRSPSWTPQAQTPVHGLRP